MLDETVGQWFRSGAKAELRVVIKGLRALSKVEGEEVRAGLERAAEFLEQRLRTFDDVAGQPPKARRPRTRRT